VKLASSVEQFWFGANTFSQKDLGNTLWAYGQLGVQVWFPFLSHTDMQAMKLMSRENSLEFDLEVFPIGFVPELGVIIGLTQGISHSPCSRFPFFELRTKTHPFLHSILLHLVEIGDDAQALRIAKKFCFIPHFSHSLELLLHETLEESVEASRSVVLQNVLKFLRQFPQFPDVVVRCARKRDPAVWNHLFKYAGEPLSLFNECLKSLQIQTAGSYLRVLQNLNGISVAKKAANRLLEVTLDVDHFEILPDLMRFLDPTQEATLDDEDYIMQEVLLSRYARKLLNQHNLRMLLQFSRIVNRELKPWLVRERWRAAQVENYVSAFSSLHSQFNIGFPQQLPHTSLFTIPTTALPVLLTTPNPTIITSPSTTPPPSPPSSRSSSFGKLNDGPSLSALIASLPPTEGGRSIRGRINSDEPHFQIGVSLADSSPGSSPRTALERNYDSDSQSKLDLEFLLREMLVASCLDWALLISTILLRPILILDLLKFHPPLQRPYLKFLQDIEKWYIKSNKKIPYR